MEDNSVTPNKTAQTAASENRKDVILDKALVMFAEKGYENTSMQDIADVAGVSRGPLYYYYSDKADLFFSVFVRSNEQMERIATEIFSATDSFFNKVEKEMYAFLDSPYRDGERMREIVRNNPENHPECYQHLVSSRKVVRYIKVHSVKQAIEQQELRPDTDPEQLVDLLFVFHRGMLSEQAFWNEEEYDKRVTLLLQGLLELLKARYEK